ncbi:MAG TPA: exonuclease domain-containing protein [Burkholderiales bacterium]|nr:exonuclease domain-containing protein [Burkholderiales bacterium]
MRWISVDTETSGLDPYKDQVLSIGACAIKERAVALAQSFEATVRQERASAIENVLVHGIGHQAQREGEAASEAAAAYLRFAGNAVVVGFHILFDVIVLQRLIRGSLGSPYRPAWHLDLALLLPALTGT